MAKKKTVGGPRPRRVTEEDIKRRKEYRSRHERDRLWQRRVMIVTVALVVISLLVLLVAVLFEQVIQPGQPITKVNGEEISTKDFQDRVRYIRWLTAEQVRDFYYLTGGDMDTIQQYAGEQINNLRRPQIIGSQVLDEMEEELIIKQAAEEMGIEVDEAAVDEQVYRYMAQTLGLRLPSDETPTPTTEPTITPTPLVSPTPSSTPRPTQTPTPAPDADDATPQPTIPPTVPPTATATLEPAVIMATVESAADDFYKDARSVVDIDRSVVRDLFYYDALRGAIQEELAKAVPEEELQVNARHILFSFNSDLPPGQAPPPTEEQRAEARARAEAAMQALEDGEPFADLAKAVSDDTSASNGGELGWASPDKYVAAFKDAVLNLEIGEISLVESEFGFHVVMLARCVRYPPMI